MTPVRIDSIACETPERVNGSIDIQLFVIYDICHSNFDLFDFQQMCQCSFHGMAGLCRHSI